MNYLEYYVIGLIFLVLYFKYILKKYFKNY